MVGRVYEESRSGRVIRRAKTAIDAAHARVTTACRNSTLKRAGESLARYTRRSFLYRWLTKEPEPEVIVIDLRETYTVGPFIALLDRLAPIVGRIWRGSTSCRLLERVRTSRALAVVAESRAVALLAAALEPPEPPERSERDPTDEDRR